MKKQKIKLIPLFLSLILIFTNVLPTTTINAANKTVNSIGSINNEDEHNHVGVDETQGKETVYSDEITKDETQNTLVYVSQASTFSVKIPKSIILNGEKTNDGINKGEYVVTVLGNIGGNEIVNVIPEYNFLMHQLGKNSLNANVTQDKLEWKHNEFNVLGNGVVSTNEMTAGSWNGSFTFNINLETYNNEIVFAKNKNGEDLYATTTYIIGVEKTELLNKLVECGMILNTNEIDLLINVESNSFEEYANTTINVSDIANTGDMIAIYHYDKNNEVWEFIDICKVDENGEIKTQFESFSPIALDKINSNEEHIHFYGDWQIVKNETCETNGLKEKICVVCENKEEIEIPATGHTSVNGGTSGIHTKCSVCGTTLSTAHSYTKTTTIEPTCTTKGTSKYTCNCGYSYTSQDINALDHSFKTKEVSATYLASASTCEKAATYYYKCDRCSAKGTETYVNGSANGHQYDEYTTTVAATCTNDGVKQRTCATCKKVDTTTITKLGHNFASTYTIDKAATCIEKGSKSQHCSRCSATQNVTEIPATGHTSVNGGTSEIHTKCSVCETTLSSTHSYTKTTTIEPTCTTKGTSKYACGCGYSYTSQDINALEHSFKTKEVSATYLASASTCEKAATYYYKCDRCNAKGTKTYVNGSANGHQYGNWETTKSATCLEKGSEIRVCSICDKVETRETNALGHNFATTYTIDKAATCTEKGSKSQHCSRCNTTQNVTEIAATGHTSVNGGTSEIHTKCSVCGTTLSSTHSYTNKITTAATCTKDGVRTYTCGCGYSYTEVIKATGHNYGDYVTTIEATCTSDGVKTKTCSVCSNKETATITKLGHNYSTTYTIDKVATCTEIGSKSQHCSRCSATQNVTEIPAMGHTSVNGGTSEIHTKCNVCNQILSSEHQIAYSLTIEPTCSTYGKYEGTCICGYKSTKQANKNPQKHTMPEEYEIQEPNCTIKGNKVKKCVECDTLLEMVLIDELGHNFSAATYSWTGYTTCVGKRTCSRCNYVESINATITSKVTKEPTCTETGTKTYTASFDNLNYTTTTKTESINPLGHYEILAKSPHATRHTECNRCEITLSSIHDCSYRINITKSATCTTSGIQMNYCECGYGVQSNIPAKGHNYTTEVVREATCISKGESIQHCTRCGHTYSSTSNTIDHNYLNYQCSYCGKQEPGIYNEMGRITQHWTSSMINGIQNTEDYSSNNVNMVNAYKIVLPDEVTKIAPSAFSGCTNLTEVVMSDNVTTIGSNAFAWCESLKVVKLSNSIKNIESQTFYYCKNLTTINIPNNLETIGTHAFYPGNKINTTIELPNTIKSIGEYAFYNCTEMSINIPDTIQSIGRNAFYNVPVIFYSGSLSGKPWGAKVVR